MSLTPAQIQFGGYDMDIDYVKQVVDIITEEEQNAFDSLRARMSHFVFSDIKGVEYTPRYLWMVSGPGIVQHNLYILTSFKEPFGLSTVNGHTIIMDDYYLNGRANDFKHHPEIKMWYNTLVTMVEDRMNLSIADMTNGNMGYWV